MNIRRKAAQRVLVLSLAAAAVVGGTVTTFLYRQRTAEANVVSMRDHAMSLYADGNMNAATPALDAYLRVRPNDPEALFAAAQARLATKRPTRDDLFDARARLQQLLAIEPDRRDARLDLLGVFEQLGYVTETLTLADRTLADVPNEPAALRARAIALGKLDRKVDAADAWQAYVATRPADVAAHVQLVVAMRRAGALTNDIVDHAKALLAAHAAEPIFAMPLAQALHDASRDVEATEVLRPLIADPPTEPALLVAFVDLLDRVRAFREAEATLARASATSPLVSDAWLERLWQAGRHAEVVTASDNLQRAGRIDANALAFRTLSLAALGRRDAASHAYADLVASARDADGLAWVDALAAEFAVPSLDASHRLATLRRAVTRDPANGIALVWLARALVATDEIDVAVVCYEESARLMPSWATPSVELTSALLDAGRTKDAIAASKAAFARAPDDPAVLAVVARTRFATLTVRPDPEEATALRVFVDRLHARLPDDRDVEQLRITLAARDGGEARAGEMIRSHLRTASRPADFEMLAVASRADSLALGDEIYAQALTKGAASLRLSYEHALDLIAQHRDDEAKKIVGSLNDGSAPRLALRSLLTARLLTRLNDPGSADAWRDALDATPADAAVLSASLVEATPVLGTGAWQQQAIDRLRDVAGEESVGWRVSRVRVLLGSTSADDHRQAAALAAELVRQWPGRGDLRVMLATALFQIGNQTAALEHLRTVVDLSPAEARTHLAYINALRMTGRSADADEALTKLATYDQSDTTARCAVAEALLGTGQAEAAVEFLRRAKDSHTIRPAGRLLLALALDAAGKPDEAATEFDAVVANDATPSAEALASAAAFARRRGNVAAADARIAAINSLPASVVDRSRATARYHASFGENDLARLDYHRAMSDAATRSDVWREATTFELSVGDIARADAIAKAATKKFPEDAALRQAASELAGRTAFANATDRPTDGAAKPSAAQLIAALSADPMRRVEGDAIVALQASRDAGRTTPALAEQLTRLAGRYPTSFDLAKVAIQANFDVGNATAAANIARRLVVAERSSDEMLAVATRTMTRAERWIEVGPIAQRWLARSPGSVEAVAAIARAKLQLGQPAEAVALLEPIKETIAADQMPEAARTFARARLLTGQGTAAFEPLRGSLSTSDNARDIWLSLLPACAPTVAADRLDEILDATPTQGYGDALRVAAACLTLSNRSQSTRLAARGASTLEPFVAKRASDRRGNLLYAELLRAADQLDDAERALRQMLARSPDDSGLKNALAYVLLSRQTSLDEARRMAQEAVDALPANAAFLDTLARCENAVGDPVAAERHFREAIRVQPTLLDAKVGLSSLLVQLRRTDEASSTAKQFGILSTATTMPTHLKQEFAILTSALTAKKVSD